MTPDYWEQACHDLARRDAVFRRLVRAYPGITLTSRGDAFQTLARAIVGQQISVKAAQSVWDRFAAKAGEVVPERVRRMRVATLRSAGLSMKKAEYVRDLAQHFAEGRIDEARFPSLSDEEIIAELTEVRGIGRWSAEMFLIFYLTRPDVLPLDDLGLQKAIRQHYNGDGPLSRDQMRELGSRWRPWSTVATWYLWRSLDPIPVEY